MSKQWHVDGHNLAAVIRRVGANWETVARCPNENATWREDARLMAAAPEMLEALKDAYPFVADDTIRIHVGTIIAKAEGRK